MSVAYKLNQSAAQSSFDCVVLDVTFLNRNTFGDETLRAEIIGLFLAQLDGAKRTLAAPIDKTAWQFLSHTLKGAAGAVGARQITALAEDWEKRQMPTTGPQRQAMADCLTKLTADFKTEVGQL